MNIHITNLHNIGGTATLAMDGVVQIAKKLDFTEMGVMKRQFYEDYWNAISHHLDGTIASLYHGDIVFFQYPTWNGPDYDKVFVDKIKLYNDVRLVIFVNDLQKLMFDSEQSILDTEISILNKADVLILPSVKMHEYMINNGLRDDIQVLYQKIWEVPSFPCFKEHQNLKKMLFTGNWNRFPFLESYHGKTIVEHFDYHKPPRDDDSSFMWRDGFKPIQLMREMSKGGYGCGLYWSFIFNGSICYIQSVKHVYCRKKEGTYSSDDQWFLFETGQKIYLFRHHTAYGNWRDSWLPSGLCDRRLFNYISGEFLYPLRS